MADARALRDEPADGCVRARGAASRRSDDDAGPVPVTALVRVYSATGCSLCERALEVVREAQAELEFELEVVAIDGNPQLEARYRERLPVVEIDGVEAFTYFVDPASLRERLAAARR